MVAKKYWRKLINEYANLVRQVKEKKSLKVLDISFQVLPGVFSPVYSSDTVWFAEQLMPLVAGKKFLEIGSGSGVISCLAAINGASTVVATDINPKAIENTQLNAEQHSLAISVRQGSVFDPIRKNELFDLIFWNHPFGADEEEFREDDMINESVFDPNYKALSDFFRRGKQHLTERGELILGSSGIARIKLIRKLSEDEGYQMKLLKKVEVPVFKGKKMKMDLRIYIFTVKRPS